MRTMQKETVAQAIASAVQARVNCIKSGNKEWQSRWTDLSYLFTLRLRLYNDAHDKRQIIIHAFKGPPTYGTHTRIDVEVRHGGEVIFPRGSLYCGTLRCTDGIEARELVLSLVGMKPGDADEKYFASYTPAQLEWVEAHGEGIDSERSSRYCDPETGECCDSEAEAKRLRKAYYAKLDAKSK